ncbi:dnaJ homolog subfamily C member 4-like [Fopius arisanus]|uniref:DnaJ homolog subfamily C member 4-like n=1 Tax=Fopius arisanus TaxID=64838 RepID=A0A9R1STG8_9HYME|nr:PREDICTED: dnaJ homolog subfamily C member 4-like [Fopius arisanus]
MSQVCRILRVIGYLKQTERHYAAHRVQNYYKTLGIKANASKEDIRAAFLTLSKQVHPDAGNNTGHAEFVRITEAYNVLSKEHTRREYDATLKYARNPIHYSPYHPFDRTIYRNHTSHFEAWRDIRGRTRENWRDDGDPFQDGLRTVEPKGPSKAMIVMICLLTSAIGFSLQILAVVKSPTFNRAKMLEKSKEYSAQLEEIRINQNHHKSLSDSIDAFRKRVNIPEE